jgi:hypothetical protein
MIATIMASNLTIDSVLSGVLGRISTDQRS